MSLLQSARIVLKWLPSRDAERVPGDREQVETIVLGVRAGTTPSALPPVRIYVGTELAQYRAERVFVWSIEQVRDPARVYEIHLMKELVGFDREQWLTGFSNYRFAIPELAGREGRAIYNDVDQIYLSDPAQLFDLDLGGHGYLAKSPVETSVMLIDCARMAERWNLESARARHRRDLVGEAAAAPGLAGPLAPEWNAFDEGYVPGRSLLLHYTTLHTQPWQPFPRRFVYQHTSAGDAWHELERSADEAGFELFSSEHRSASAALVAQRFADATSTGTPEAAAPQLDSAALGSLREALGTLSPKRVLLAELDGQPTDPQARGELAQGASVERAGPWTASDSGGSPHDAVLSTSGLETLPVEDAPWVVESLFARAGQLLWVRFDDTPPSSSRDRQPWHQDLAYWEALFRSIGLRHPDVHWRLVAAREGRTQTCEGGRLLTREPVIWVLRSDKGGDTSMSLGLAQAMGLPFEIKEVRFNRLARPHKRKLGALAARLDLRWLGLDTARSAPLAAPWPDVVIATGWRPAIVARWIRERSGGRTRCVQMGRKAGQIVDLFDVVVACKHFGLAHHPRRVETLLPLNRVTDGLLSEATASWPDLLGQAPGPRIVLLVGGTTERHRLDSETAWHLGEEARSFAAELGGSVFAVTSRRTGAKATAALEAGLGYAGKIHRFEGGSAENPYFGFLAQADILVVTGESESMIAEAAAVGKPLYVYPLPERSSNTWTRLNDWLVYRAHFRPFKKGAEARRKRRHQQGLEYLLAKGLDKGLVRPRRDTDRLNRSLVQRGVAHFFGEPLDDTPRTPLREANEVEARVRGLLGLPAPVDRKSADMDRGQMLPSPRPAGDVPDRRSPERGEPGSSQESAARATGSVAASPSE